MITLPLPKSVGWEPIGQMTFSVSVSFSVGDDEIIHVSPVGKFQLIIPDEILEWFEENNIVFTREKTEIGFRNEQDAIAYKLRWL